jgi:hypothetical protein
MIQVGAYAGWPTMAHANRQYREVLAEDKAKAAAKGKKKKAKKKA